MLKLAELKEPTDLNWLRCASLVLDSIALPHSAFAFACRLALVTGDRRAGNAGALALLRQLHVIIIMPLLVVSVDQSD